MILAALACIIKRLLGISVVVDRHTTFRLGKKKGGSLKVWIFMRLHYFTLRMADLTIVTNRYLAELVEEAHGTAAILPDKLPEFGCVTPINLGCEKNIVLVSSFGEDEPFAHVIQAAKRLEGSGICIHVTGDVKKADPLIRNAQIDSIKFTGFIPDEMYPAYLLSADAVMVLTTADQCMLCGCYEAVSLERPLITSRTQVLEDYFSGAVFVEDDGDQIYNAILAVLDNPKKYAANVRDVKKHISRSWMIAFHNIEGIISNIENQNMRVE
jgi:glycosyltransferase involved in cell wall biosynthesis